MAETRACRQCGSQLADEASDGLCPQCALDEVSSEQLTVQTDIPGPNDPTIELIGAQRGPRPIATTFPRRFGEFELLEEVARGGMGVVYRARQLSLNRIVAVKMILAGQLASAAHVQRFRAEAEAAANLQHANIVAIYEVGERDGQHYFAMEYVAGPNLAEIVRQHPLPARHAAQIVRTISEAVHYAHQRGILHRDLKPSNVLLLLANHANSNAADGKITDWSAVPNFQDAAPKITDFGLAKRMEGGSELTGTNVILGTPSYMPPECAAGGKAQFGPAGDVYSLGAVLYELLTARPPFRAESQLETIIQAIELEPVRPRLLNRNVPRDLETICLKCLQKNPHSRYASAAALAEDLGRFLSGDPIRARRPGLFELSARWVLKQRRSVATALFAALISSFVVIAVLISYLAYSQWRLGYLSINTDGSLLTAEILDSSDQLVVPRFSVPTQELVSLPSGPYNIRLTGPSLLSETYQLFVERAGRVEFRVPSDTRQLWEPIQIPRKYEVVEMDGRTDLILLTHSSVRRVNGRTAENVWEVDLNAAARKLSAGFEWDWLTEMEQSGRGSLDHSPQLVEPLFDIDGDKTPDLVWAGRHQAFLVAVSSANGEVLWCHLDEKLRSKSQDPADEPYTESAILGRPAGQDIDGDGIADLLVTCASVERDPATDHGWARSPRRWIELISGRSGKSLWKANLDKYFAANSAAQPPITSHWPTSRNTWSMSGFTGSSDAGYYEQHVAYLSGPMEFSHVPFAADLTTIESEVAAVLVAGSSLVKLNAKTGETISPVHDLGFISLREPVLADLDGDDRSEVLVFRGQPRSIGTGRDQVVEVSALALPSANKLWTIVLEATWDGFNWYDVPPQWPLVTDLDGDGNQEVVLPSQLAKDAKDLSTTWSGLQLLDGRTGQLRWHARMRSMHRQIDRFVVGPDIDSDGHLDLFTATTVAWPDQVQKFSLFVDAISGRDGKSIWWHQVPLGDSHHVCEGLGIDPPFWWNTGLDGWPQLVVPYLPQVMQGVPKTLIFSAGTGRLTYTAAGVCDAAHADLDGDGVGELLSFRPHQAGRFDAGGKLVAVRAVATDGWQRLGGIWSPAEDLNNDGIADLIKADGYATAISGQDGSVLWHAKADANSFTSPPMPLGDFNRDGSPDVLVPYRLGTASVNGMGMIPLQAISGRTGERLWAADSVTVFVGMQYVEVADLEKDGRPEVVFVSAMDPRSLGSTTWQWWLTVYSADTGEVRWKQPLSDLGNFSGQFAAHPQIQTDLFDLNADGVLDLVFPVITMQPDFAVRAFNGQDGKPLWSYALPPRKGVTDVTRYVPSMRVATFDGESQPEVIVGDVVPERSDIVGLDINSGEERRKWTSQRVGAESADATIAVAKSHENKVQQIGLFIRRTAGDHSSTELLILDHHAKYQHLRNIEPLTGTSGTSVNLSCFDVDYDGKHEWLFVENGKLMAVSADLAKTIWEWPVPHKPSDSIDVQLEQRSPWIVAHVTSEAYQSSLYLLDQRTGQMHWKYESKDGQASLLHHPNEDQWPLLVTSNEQATTCRRAMQVGPLISSVSSVGTIAINTGRAGNEIPDQTHKSGVSAKSAPQTPRKLGSGLAARAAAANSHAEDPRLVRRLPWAHMRHGVLEVALSMAIGVVALVLPGSILVTAVRRQRWSLRRLLAIPVLVATVIVFFRLLASDTVDLAAYTNGFSGPLMFGWHPTAQVLKSPAWLLLLGIQGIPFLFFLAAVIGSIRHGQWRRLANIAGLYLVMATVLMGAMLMHDVQQKDPREHYAWRDVYWALYPPAFVAGTVLLFVSSGRQIWSAVRLLRTMDRSKG